MFAKTPLRSVSRLVSLLFFTTLLLSCAHPAAGPRVEFSGDQGRPRVSIPELEKRIHALINKERKKNGLAPLEWSNRLSDIARLHSKDMAKRNYFSHYSPEGRDFSYRYKAGGFSCEVRVGNIIYCGGENIFQNNLYDRVMIRDGKKFYDWNSLDKIAETTVKGWMHSPGHRKNILTPYFKSEGIGVSVSEDDEVLITQNFC